MNTRELIVGLSLVSLLVACIEPRNADRDATSRPDNAKAPAGQSSREPEETRRPGEQSSAMVTPARQEFAELRSDRDMTTGKRALTSPSAAQAYFVDRENYLHYEANGVKVVSEEPISTFSVDVDTAAYANVRRMLSREGRLPPADAVRIEEMINYFSYSYEEPQDERYPFSINTELAPAPWSEQRVLLQVGLKGYQPPREQRPPANLVFLVDVSGSMRSADKLELVKKSLRLLVNQMNAQDRIALAVYAGAAGTVLACAPGDQKATILAAVDALEAGGSTHGSAGIKLAYQLAEQNRIEGGINRVIIASDGDMNVGTVNIEALKDLVTRKRDRGIALTTLGFGSGNYNYALMEQLADVGNGNAAYIDTLKEAQKVMVNEMASTLLTIAQDVKIQVEFNPALVREYRLIGYENRLLRREDFSNDRVDAGDIGAGHTVTALYELVLAGSDGVRIPALRYGRSDQPETAARGDELAFIRLRFKAPGAADSIETGRAVLRSALTSNLEGSSDDLRVAASVAGFGELLRGGRHLDGWHYRDALDLARGARGPDPHGYRSELIHLLELAQSLSSGS